MESLTLKQLAVMALKVYWGQVINLKVSLEGLQRSGRGHGNKKNSRSKENAPKLWITVDWCRWSLKSKDGWEIRLDEARL